MGASYCQLDKLILLWLVLLWLLLLWEMFWLQVLGPVREKQTSTVPPIFQQTDVIGMVVVDNQTRINLTLKANKDDFKTRLLEFYQDLDRISGNLTVQVIKEKYGNVFKLVV